MTTTPRNRDGLRDDFPRPDLFEVRDFNINRYDDISLVYRSEHDLHREGGQDAGAILFRLAVDGHSDIVTAEYGQTGDLRVVTRAIEALTAIRAELERAYKGRPHRVGRCVEYGDLGPL